MSQFRSGGPLGPRAPIVPLELPETDATPIESVIELTVAPATGPTEVSKEFAINEVIEATIQPASESGGEPAPDPELSSLLETTAVAEAEPAPEELAEPLVEAEIVAEPEPAPEPAAPIRCEFCGMEYTTPPGKFCDQCGRRFTRVMPDVAPEGSEYHRCPQCSHRNRIEVQICAECGNLIREGAL